MSAHTPGPWSLVFFDDVICINSGNYEIARLPFYAPYSPPKEEVGANAHLSAAAPDLLAALVRLVEWVTLDMVEMQREGHTVSHLANACDIARAAISKAKGEKKTHV